MTEYTGPPSKMENAVSAVKHTLGMDRTKPTSTAAPATDTSDTAPHEKNIVDGIKGLIRAHSGGSVNKNEDSALQALDRGTSEAPGNNTDY